MNWVVCRGANQYLNVVIQHVLGNKHTNKRKPGCLLKKNPVPSLQPEHLGLGSWCVNLQHRYCCYIFIGTKIPSLFTKLWGEFQVQPFMWSEIKDSASAKILSCQIFQSTGEPVVYRNLPENLTFGLDLDSFKKFQSKMAKQAVSHYKPMWKRAPF